MHDASVRLVPPGIAVRSLGAADRTSMLKLNSADIQFSRAVCVDGVRSVDEFMLSSEKGARK